MSINTFLEEHEYFISTMGLVSTYFFVDDDSAFVRLRALFVSLESVLQHTNYEQCVIKLTVWKCAHYGKLFKT